MPILLQSLTLSLPIFWLPVPGFWGVKIRKQAIPLTFVNTATIIANGTEGVLSTLVANGNGTVSTIVANGSERVKKGSKSDPSNYRPISLTSVICKLMESLVRDHIIEFFSQNSVKISSVSSKADRLHYSYCVVWMIGPKTWT